MNQINDPTTFAFVTVHCDTHNYPPTKVTWRRNDIEVEIDGLKYDASQRVINRWESYYRNVLVIRDIAEITDGPEYTCIVENAAGYNTRTIRLNIQITVFLSLLGKPIVFKVY